jgi:hypothetical protein
MSYKLHWAYNAFHFGQYYAACSGWMKVPYTLMVEKVTCKACKRMLKKRGLIKS